VSTSAPPPPTDDLPDIGKKEGIWESIAPRVFIPAGAFILAFVLYGAIWTDSFSDVIGEIQAWITEQLGWYYIIIVAGFIIFALFVGLSRFGNIRLGKQDEKPEYSTGAWLAMLFSAGMGIGLVFWGVAEPLNHLASPRPGAEGNFGNAGEYAMTQTLMHWGVHAWAIYVVVGLAVAYSVFRKGRSMSIRWVLEPLLGDRVKGWIGDLVDVIAIAGTVFGVATSLGLGASQIGAGFNFLGWVDDDAGKGLLVGIIVVITLIATLSVVSGIGKGIKWLSQTNVSLAGLLLLFVLIAGPTVFVLRQFVESIGSYLQNFVVMTFDSSNMFGQDGQDWQAAWTVFYWGWWISWAPFVGVFIARISRGRTIRQFVLGVLAVPVLISILWFAVMGGSGIYRQLFGDGDMIGEDGSVATEGSLFQLLDAFPGGTVVIVGTVILISIFFITSSDSGSLVVDMLASGGDPNPPTWSRIFWALAEGGVAIVLLLAGTQGDALLALRGAAIVLALPFSVVMVAMLFATWKALRHDHLTLQLEEDRRKADEMAAQVTETFSDHVEQAVSDADGAVATATRADAPPRTWWDTFLDRLKSRPGSPLE
jgi:choline/glycine/proline betaine transport protein